MTQAPENPFWDFSVTVYGRAGVAPACLRLQDQFGVDVNVLLFCCWVAAQRRIALAPTDVMDILTLTSSWKSDVVGPLRAVRRQLKETYRGYGAERQESLRSLIKKTELHAERLQQDALYAAANAFHQAPVALSHRRETAADNIRHYSETLDAPVTGEGEKDIAAILDAAFTD